MVVCCLIREEIILRFSTSFVAAKYSVNPILVCNIGELRKAVVAR